MAPFTPTAQIDTAPITGTARGQYIVTSLADCAGCHTVDPAKPLAGGFSQELGGIIVPNITPDKKTGIGDWSADDIAHLLQTGEIPTIPGNPRFHGGNVGGPMAGIVQGATKFWTAGDAQAVGAYLKTIPAVDNKPLTPSAQRGQIIFYLTAGCGCHSPDPAKPLAGGEKFEGPFGVVYSKNITPDKATGIGNWTDQQIMDVLRKGIDDQGHQLFPIMPYMVFSNMAKSDMMDLIAYLRSVDPISNTVPADNILVPVSPFTPTVQIDTAPISGTLRGKYIVTSLADCGGCHTVDQNKPLAGGINPELGGINVPNITPNKLAGIGAWSEDDIAHLLLTKELPKIPDDPRFNGGNVNQPMAGVIDSAFKFWSPDDAKAVAAYLKTVPQYPGQLYLPAAVKAQ